MVFSEGFPREVRFQSPILDFEDRKNVNALRRAAAFLQATRFDLFLEDSRLGPDVRQRVEPGDANPQVGSSTNIVELPLDRALFAHLSVYPRVLTPNGDGLGDRLFISLNLINVWSTDR